MPLRRRQLLGIAATVLATSALSSMAPAQAPYPTRPVRVIMPFPAGGGTDILARLIAQKLADRLRQPFYVENIAGAAGSAGTGQAARAAPDGHTLLFVFGSYVVNPSLYARVPMIPTRTSSP